MKECVGLWWPTVLLICSLQCLILDTIINKYLMTCIIVPPNKDTSLYRGDTYTNTLMYNTLLGSNACFKQFLKLNFISLFSLDESFTSCIKSSFLRVNSLISSCILSTLPFMTDSVSVSTDI